MEQTIRNLCKAKGWVDADHALMVADVVGYDKVIGILECQPVKRVGRECPRFVSYMEYLQTGHWQTLRKEVLEKAGYRCMLCNGTGILNVHHRTYERLWGELPEDVIVLCGHCHAKFHDKVPTLAEVSV